ncbi:MAG: nucleoside 2-deoxyribosyltransferase [Candidatus Nealsonbacteria bacterium]|nr:nucleoside 2-deoxyribosyltransferase [Candidatus Nealsonbacteria bacterium]
MKIYFAGSIRAGRVDQESYFKIIEYLKKYGQVLTEHVGDKDLTDSGEKNISEGEIYERDMSWLKETDVFIAEISIPSLGVGYEIAKAEEWGKRILCLCRKPEDGKKISAIIKGNKNIILKEYNDLDEAFQYIDDFLNKTDSNTVRPSKLIARAFGLGF